MMNMGAASVQLRRSLKLRQQDVADEIGLTRKHLSALEVGRHEITIKTIRKYWDAYHVDLYLMAGGMEAVAGTKLVRVPIPGFDFDQQDAQEGWSCKESGILNSPVTVRRKPRYSGTTKHMANENGSRVNP